MPRRNDDSSTADGETPVRFQPALPGTRRTDAQEVQKVMPIAYHRKPDISHCSSREMVVPDSQNAFEAELIQWMSDCVIHDWGKAKDLVLSVPRLSQFRAIARDAPQMGMSNKRKIYADF